MKIRLGIVLLGLLIGAVSCTKNNWVPNAEELKTAESIAKLYALQTLSDQAGTPDVMALHFTPGGPDVIYPIAFSFNYTPYSRFRQKFWGDHFKGAKRIHVLYFNPADIPNWEQADILSGEFPAHFSVTVDMDALCAVESNPPERPTPAHD